ncbi:hypothetical protein FHR90_002969 [Endobacter medicaginis]|uniref:Purine nucleoside phosphorylase n=3 Tax=Endobacter medicaginis TaxID=1181271 RepID=A0A839V3K3_9PROT|nr:polyphenol oxidase family protein [Endobacter medicaginis]MBB3175120.1 hypothetical protein [Endobacter medicaginis]MCX5476435.1 polyphenol oxidase family protein [Endobacter medicaginis]
MRADPVMRQQAPGGAEYLASPLLASLNGVRHGFFTRRGGVSESRPGQDWGSLNCSYNSGDAPEALVENRRRVAEAVGVAPANLLGVTQVHSADVVRVDAPWAPGAGGVADALVTSRPEIGLGVVTADCAPVLFADADAGVIGAAHAGWRGAAGGVLEATLAAMAELGADSITAVVGPCIGPDSYEVGEDMREQVLGCDGSAEGFFRPGRGDRFLFDLPGYCVARLTRGGARASGLGRDTLSDPEHFFSHRRRTLAGGGRIGHQISAIALVTA